MWVLFVCKQTEKNILFDSLIIVVFDFITSFLSFSRKQLFSMLQFPPIPHRLKYKRMNESELKQNENLFDSFPVHSIHLFIPDSEGPFKTVPSKDKIENLLVSAKNVYFILKDVPVTVLIQNVFLENFIRKGLLLGVSFNARINVENFVSIIPPGKLVLHLEKNIAECLALEKEKGPKKKKGIKHFQTIIINLMSPELSPGKKHYQFIDTELSKLDEIKFDLLLKWEPHGNICPQSMKSYFISQGFECIACKPKHNFSTKYSVPVPKISFDVLDNDVIESFFEWIGMQICGIEYSVDKDVYASSLTVPESSETLNRLHKCSFEGFYTKNDVLSIIKEMSKLFESDSSLQFVVLCVSGYQDSYIVANGFQYFSCDDKQVCVVIFPSCKYLIFTLNVR